MYQHALIITSLITTLLSSNIQCWSPVVIQTSTYIPKGSKHLMMSDMMSDATQMKVLRSTHAVAAVGKKLRNCAQSYIRFIQNKEYILVVLVDSGRPLALGGCWYREGQGLGQGHGLGQWAQIVEFANTTPSAQTIRYFDNYLDRFLTPWVQSHAKTIAS